MSNFITVRLVPGRVAFDAPVGGARIPSDINVRVRDTRWIRMLIAKHGDLELINTAIAAPSPSQSPASQISKPAPVTAQVSSPVAPTSAPMAVVAEAVSTPLKSKKGA